MQWPCFSAAGSAQPAKVISCRASYCEIYNEALYDLLKFSKQQLPVRWDAHRGFHAPDLMQRDCSTMADLTQVCVWAEVMTGTART